MKHGIIEVRGLSLDGKKWHIGELFHNFRKGEKGLRPFISEWVYEASEIPGMDGQSWEESYPVQTGTIGVRSGLKDKDGKVLYGGDLIQYKARQGEMVLPLQYFSELGIWGLYTKGDPPFHPEGALGHAGSSTSYRPYILDSYHQKRMKLVGNIWENPDMNIYHNELESDDLPY